MIVHPMTEGAYFLRLPQPSIFHIDVFIVSWRKSCVFFYLELHVLSNTMFRLSERLQRQNSPRHMHFVVVWIAYVRVSRRIGKPTVHQHTIPCPKRVRSTSKQRRSLVIGENIFLNIQS